MNSTRSQVLHLYRTVLKRSRTFPLQKTRGKICFNIRDAIDYYRNETDPVKIKELLTKGQLFIRIMDDIEGLRPEHLNILKDDQYGKQLYADGVKDLRKWEESLKEKDSYDKD